MQQRLTNIADHTHSLTMALFSTLLVFHGNDRLKISHPLDRFLSKHII